jgi:hypothetical protein
LFDEMTGLFSGKAIYITCEKVGNNLVTPTLGYLDRVEEPRELKHAQRNGFVVAGAQDDGRAGAGAVIVPQRGSLRFDALLVQQEPKVQQEADEEQPSGRLS